MEKEMQVTLLKNNFNNIERKFDDFFKNGTPRWPGEEQDYLRNHHKNLDNLSLRSLTFEQIGLTDLPEQIMKELELAFDAFRNGLVYQ